MYGKCNCKACGSGCCKHVAALLYQLVEFKQLNLDFIPDYKTCTDQLQQWHVPGEGMNHSIKFSGLKFEKADLKGNERQKKVSTFFGNSKRIT